MAEVHGEGLSALMDRLLSVEVDADTCAADEDVALVDESFVEERDEGGGTDEDTNAQADAEKEGEQRNGGRVRGGGEGAGSHQGEGGKGELSGTTGEGRRWKRGSGWGGSTLRGRRRG